MKHYSVIKLKEVLVEATTWVHYIIKMLNERSQSQKDQILFDAIHMKYPEWANLYRQKID